MESEQKPTEEKIDYALELRQLRELLFVKLAEKRELPILERVVELEVKMSKLWDLLVEENNRGEDKPTKFGKRFAKRVL